MGRYYEYYTINDGISTIRDNVTIKLVCDDASPHSPLQYSPLAVSGPSFTDGGMVGHWF